MAEHPKRSVLFRGCLQPHLWQQCSLCSLEIPLSSPRPTDWFGYQSHFGALELELRTGTWALGVHQVPSSSEWFLVGSLKPPTYVWRLSGASDKTGPLHFQPVNTVGIEVSSAVRFCGFTIPYWIICWHRHSFCCICWLERLKLFFIWCNCKLGLD